jgi:peptidoglycan/xylan/chitin deacetylase (PgdA/CDA1 family)
MDMLARSIKALQQASPARTVSGFLLASLTLIILSALPSIPLVKAQKEPGAIVTPFPARERAIRLSAGDNGPYFTLADLYNRPRPSLEHLLSQTIKPPPTMEYPALLYDIPIAPRTYTSETVASLAQHEIRYGDRQNPTMALTFDCEAGTNSTRKIIQTLREKNVTATFFILGKYVYMFPDIIREIAAGGHEFGNHSFFHPLYYDIAPITATQEITYTEAVLDWAVGEHVPMRYFRFPYGGRNDPLRLLAARLGYQSAFWDLDPRGWEPHVTAEDVVTYIRSTARSGGIVIMHCGSWDDAHALAGIIDAIRERGIEPGTLTSVLTDADRDVPFYVMPGQARSP